jgi:exopolysaccharide biosynthesis protein
MKKLLNIILLISLIIILLFSATYLYIRYMPDKSISKQASDFSLSATELAKEYENSPKESDRKFIDRIMEVTGTISEITYDQNKSVVFILRENEAELGILCTLNQDNTKRTLRYKKGDRVTIKGTCSGMLFEVVLNKCIIVN